MDRASVVASQEGEEEDEYEEENNEEEILHQDQDDIDQDNQSDTGKTDRVTPLTQRSGGSQAKKEGSKDEENERDSVSRKTSGPVSVASRHSSAHLKDSDQNPFTMPSDNEIFLLRDRERQNKLKERIRQRGLKVHEKTTYISRMNAKSKAILQPSEIELQSSREKSANEKLKEDQLFVLRVTRDRQRDKETLSDYIKKKREMFLVQYSLGVKRDEMVKLERIAAEQERKLEQAERYLEEDAGMFDEFLKENDRAAADAIKTAFLLLRGLAGPRKEPAVKDLKAEMENRAKLDKIAEIKRINTQIMGIRGEVSKYEDILKEYLQYKKFLINVAPKEWQDHRLATIQMSNEWKEKEVHESKRRTTQDMGYETETLGLRNLIREAREDDCLEVGGSLYFSEPKQLLDLFAELEEQNLSLIQNSQETEEALEEMKQNVTVTKQRLNNETDMLNEQIERLTIAIAKEEEKAHELESKAKMFSYGEYKSEDQDKMLSELNKKVEEVYKSCIGDNQANISTLQMLTNLENRLEELFEQIEMMQPDKVEAAEKAKEKERRLKMKLEKADEQKRLQLERLQRALERSLAPSNKRYGRPLVFRSEPPQRKKTDAKAVEQANREEEELAYYFLP